MGASLGFSHLSWDFNSKQFKQAQMIRSKSTSLSLDTYPWSTSKESKTWRFLKIITRFGGCFVYNCAYENFEREIEA